MSTLYHKCYNYELLELLTQEYLYLKMIIIYSTPVLIVFIEG